MTQRAAKVYGLASADSARDTLKALVKEAVEHGATGRPGCGQSTVRVSATTALTSIECHPAALATPDHRDVEGGGVAPGIALARRSGTWTREVTRVRADLPCSMTSQPSHPT